MPPNTKKSRLEYRIRISSKPHERICIRCGVEEQIYTYRQGVRENRILFGPILRALSIDALRVFPFDLALETSVHKLFLKSY